ncbi:hypothetical protein LEP1GSC021_2351 [Leptospira noguchii str. 1993005606]|nr:hypothetical protein LEP1GSC021_2351 [Leptospira noguchii str. 1993005606]
MWELIQKILSKTSNNITRRNLWELLQIAILQINFENIRTHTKTIRIFKNCNATVSVGTHILPKIQND